MASRNDVRRAAERLARSVKGLGEGYSSRTVPAEVTDTNYVSRGYLWARIGSSMCKVLCDPTGEFEAGQTIWASRMGPEAQRCWIHRTMSAPSGHRAYHDDGHEPGEPDDPPVPQPPVPEEFPIGGMCIWSGSVDTIPTGFQLADGSNGTPDFRDRFVITGWEYSVTEDNPEYGIDEWSGSHYHVIYGTVANESTHKHPWSAASIVTSPPVYTGLGDEGPGAVMVDCGHSHAVPGGISTAGTAHKHDLKNTRNSTKCGYLESGDWSPDTENRPPFYALCYIIRMS